MSKKALKIFTASAVAASVVTPVASASTTFNDITPTTGMNVKQQVMATIRALVVKRVQH